VPIVPAIEVNTELGRIFDLANAILERRQRRDRDYWANLEDELEAVRTIVSRMDRLYVELLEDIQWGMGESEEADVEVCIRQIEAFLHEDQLMQLLIDLNGRIEVASQSRDFRRRKYRELITVLRSLDKAIESYRDHIDEIKSGARQLDSKEQRLWNMHDVLRALRGEESELPMRELCEEAIRNRRLDLVHAISDLVGRGVANTNLRRRKGR
jgi:chromosome segregation ATPase